MRSLRSLVPLVQDELEADSGVILVQEREKNDNTENCGRTLCLTVQQVDDADRLLDNRVKAVRAQVVQADLRTSQTSSGALSPSTSLCQPAAHRLIFRVWSCA